MSLADYGFISIVMLGRGSSNRFSFMPGTGFRSLVETIVLWVTLPRFLTGFCGVFPACRLPTRQLVMRRRDQGAMGGQVPLLPWKIAQTLAAKRGVTPISPSHGESMAITARTFIGSSCAPVDRNAERAIASLLKARSAPHMAEGNPPLLLGSAATCIKRQIYFGNPYF